jgi:hypothetical protein
MNWIQTTPGALLEEIMSHDPHDALRLPNCKDRLDYLLTIGEAYWNMIYADDPVPEVIWDEPLIVESLEKKSDPMFLSHPTGGVGA